MELSDFFGTELSGSSDQCYAFNERLPFDSVRTETEAELAGLSAMMDQQSVMAPEFTEYSELTDL